MAKQPTRAPTKTITKTPLPTTTTTPTVKKEEKDFSQLLLNTPEVPVSSPQIGPPPSRSGPRLPLPGSTELDALSYLRKDRKTGWFLIEFIPERSDKVPPPRRVLFSQYLESIEHLADRTPPLRLRISGRNTVYRKMGFILLTGPPTIVGRQQRVLPTPGTSPQTERPTTREKSRDGTGRSPEDIRRVLLEGDPGNPLPVPPLPDPRDVQPAPSVPPAPRGSGMSYGTDELVVDKLIRLVPERVNGWLLARFESDNTLRQPPLRLLPCRMLERAEAIASAVKVRMNRFRVSGHITHYKGRRYLLLTKLIRMREMDQF